MALQDNDMLEQAENMRRMIASSRILSQQIENKSDMLFEAIAKGKDKMKDTGFQKKDEMDVIKDLQNNTKPEIAVLPLVETKNSGKRKMVF